ncbi:uncharacterized protein LOC111800622 [Cucurbita pepo subsp. pepo]|uniref:uncharacterized protein LOC111800622 n=1 Tax=Cucurbita pepo subsp. pepo TaxID=3664 RepID=UPI000C9DA473|nr:uncharacterized protein LOC111800622 [Cucurbita pepo subsp. pepo]
MANGLSSGDGDGFSRKFSASEDHARSPFHPDEMKFPLIVSNPSLQCEVRMNSSSSASPEENAETSVEKMVVCDWISESSENGGNMGSLVDETRILDVELGEESFKVDAVHDFEMIGAVEDGNQEVAMDEVEAKDFVTIRVPSFDGNQDCAKKEIVQEVQFSTAMEADSKEAFERTEELLRKEADTESILEMKKKLLLEELEAMLVPGEEIHLEKDNCGKTMLVDEEKISGQQNDSENTNVLRQSHLSLGNSLKIEVIDETALVEPVHVSKIGNGEEIDISCPTRSMQINVSKSHEPERVGKKARRSRRRTREAKISEVHWNLGNVNELDKKNAEGSKIVYSRKDMEALRFVNVSEQSRLWEAICKELMPVVAREYSSLTSSNYPMKTGSTSGPRQHFEKGEEASSFIRDGCSESLDAEIEDMEGDNEITNVEFPKPSCCLSVSEDSEDDKYYNSIQRPAFLVEGEPNFDSGPPEDGLEYLRRVRWEASHIPNVAVAKVDRSNFKKERSVYMPVIPAIANCPQNLLPSKEWEDAFLADFSKLRQVLSCPEGLMQSDFIFHEKIDSVSPDSIDQPSVILPANDIDSQPPEEPNASTSSKENSGNNYPSLSAISKMNSVFRVSSLRKRINSLETQTTLSRTDCLWLFALSAAVDTPLDADTCASFRSLLRKCASLRAEKSELDDEVIMLNILATISGRYFGQSEN